MWRRLLSCPRLNRSVGVAEPRLRPGPVVQTPDHPVGVLWRLRSALLAADLALRVPRPSPPRMALRTSSPARMSYRVHRLRVTKRLCGILLARVTTDLERSAGETPFGALTTERSGRRPTSRLWSGGSRWRGPHVVWLLYTRHACGRLRLCFSRWILTRLLTGSGVGRLKQTPTTLSPNLSLRS